MGRRFDEAMLPSNLTPNGASTAAVGAPHPSRQPNYNLTRVQEALEHLASIDLIELCNEAKVERCRATRDLRSCGRHVESVLNSCGHASLCTECCQRCDICPICRIPIPKNGNRLRLRLYYECIEAGLISKKCDDRFQEKEDGERQIAADIERLYSLFDVALENNLDSHTVQEMKMRLSSLLKFSVKLAGISNVLEVLESSFKGALSAQLHDLHHLQESILKTKQHMEMMIWCIRHHFLENVKPRYTNITSWRAAVRERKSAAIMRSWPDSVNNSAGSGRTNGSTLFIEDALSNIDIDQGYTHERAGELEIASLQKDESSSFFRSKIEGMAGCYPFENLRAAADVLFLHGSSDLVLAKQAIGLKEHVSLPWIIVAGESLIEEQILERFIIDLLPNSNSLLWDKPSLIKADKTSSELNSRHWTRPGGEWRHIIDDFAATFNITRHSLLESFTFYLLDDYTDDALQPIHLMEACHLLPEISGPTTHPKVAQVLLERQNPDAALMVLRWCGLDGGAQLVSLGEAVTAVQVRVECGLLTEAFMYQRTLCMKVKEKKLKHGHLDDLKDECRTWVDWMEALVTEICCLCIRRNLVDRMIELPWNSVEEKYLHKSLLDFALDDPSTTVGSLLVVFYLQRYRYVEAYQVDRKLQSVEQDFISKNSVSEEFLFRMRSASHWRAGLVEKSIELLPEVQQQEAKTGKLPEIAVSPVNDTGIPARSDPANFQEPNSTSLLVPASIDSSLLFRMEKAIPSSKHSVLETPSKLGGFSNISHFELGNHGTPSILQGSFFTNAERVLKPQGGASKKFKFEDTRTPGIRHVSAMMVTPLKEFNRSSSRLPQNRTFQDHQFDEVSPEKEENGFTHRLQNTRPSSLAASGKWVPSDGPCRPLKAVPSDDPMGMSWSHGEKGSVEDGDGNGNGGPRWRSDDTSEDELQSPDRLTGPTSYSTAMRGVRRSRLARR
ncbi:unnamed protein product [Camellia sinensis]